MNPLITPTTPIPVNAEHMLATCRTFLEDRNINNPRRKHWIRRHTWRRWIRDGELCLRVTTTGRHPWLSKPIVTVLEGRVRQKTAWGQRDATKTHPCLTTMNNTSDVVTYMRPRG